MTEGETRQTSTPIPMLGLRSRAEPGQAKVHHSVKVDNFVLGKHGSLKKRMGLKKITDEKVLAPSYELNGHKTCWLRMRTNDYDWPGSPIIPTGREGSYAVTFRAKLLGIEDCATSAANEIVGWSETGSSGPWYPQELMDLMVQIDVSGSTFVPGPIVCLAATTDPYHRGQTTAEGMEESTGWALCAVQDSATGKWYCILLIFTVDQYGEAQTYAICAPHQGTNDYDPFVANTYLVGFECGATTDPADDTIYLRVGDWHATPDTNEYYKYVQKADYAITDYLNADEHPVFIGGAPDLDHYRADDSEYNPQIWEFAPSTRARCTNPLKIHLPAHMAVGDLALWSTAGGGGSSFETFRNMLDGQGFLTGTRVVDSGNPANYLLNLYPLSENRGLPQETTGDGDILDILSMSPIRNEDGWETGINSLHFGGVAPMLIPRGELYRQSFGGKRGKYGHLYPRDQEAFFVYWKPLTRKNPDDQVIAAFVSPQNTPDGLADEKTWRSGDLRGYADKGAVHWGIKLFYDEDNMIATGDKKMYLTFFCRGREFSEGESNLETNHDDETIAQCNTAFYGISAAYAVELGVPADVIGTRYVFGYSRVATWSESDGEYSNNNVTITAWNVDTGAEVGTATIPLGSGGAAHYIWSTGVGGVDDTHFDGTEYDSGKSLIPTWINKSIGVGKYYLLVGGYIQPGWSGPEDITDIRERWANFGGEIERTTFRTEEITDDGHFSQDDYGEDPTVVAGNPEDWSAHIGIPEQAGGLHSYRFTEEQAEDIRAVAIGTVDKSRVQSISIRTAPWASISVNAACDFLLTVGPPGTTQQIHISGANAQEAFDSIGYLYLKYCSVYVIGNVLTFLGSTSRKEVGAGVKVLASCAGAADDWVFETDNEINITIDATTDDKMHPGTGDADFYMRHTVVGTIGECAGFGYLKSPLGEDDMSTLCTQKYISTAVRTRLKNKAISLWDVQEERGGRLVDDVGGNTIWDTDLFPIQACPKTITKNAGLASDMIELDIHHSIPWGLNAFSEQQGIRRTESLFTTDTNAAEVVGGFEVREAANSPRQFIVSTAGIFEVVPGTGNQVATLRHVGNVPGDIPSDTPLSKQYWGNDVFFCCGAGRPLQLTSEGKLVDFGNIGLVRLWWNKHELVDPTSISQVEDVDFYCHTLTDDEREAGGLVTSTYKSGNAGIFTNKDYLHVEFPINSVKEPEIHKRWPDPKAQGFSYSESYHAALCTRALTAPNKIGQTWRKSPLHDQPKETRTRCLVWYFITGVNKNYDPPLETPRSPIMRWDRVHTNTQDPDGDARSVGFFTTWYASEPSNSSAAKIVHCLSKSPAPDITHIRVYRSQRAGGDFYLEGEYPVPKGYGSDGELFVFDVCVKPDEEISLPNTSLNNFPPPSGLTLLAEFRGRMFYAGDPAFPHRLYYTPVGKPTAVPPIYHKNLIGNITGMVTEKDRLVVTTDAHTYEVMSADFDPSEVVEGESNLQGTPVLVQRIKAESGCVAGRGMSVIDDIGLVLPTERSISLLDSTLLMPISGHIEGFSDEDRPAANAATTTGFRMIYPQALNMDLSKSWVAAYDKFNSCWIMWASLFGETLGNNVALVWYPHVPSPGENMPREFTTFSLLQADDATDATTDGIFISDMFTVRDPSTGIQRLWCVAKNGYIYEMNTGHSDGVDYVCLVDSDYERLTKRGAVSEENTSTTAPYLLYSMDQPYKSPLEGYEYDLFNRGDHFGVLDAGDVLTALAAYGIDNPYVGAVITFTKETDGTVYRRVITAITSAAAASDDVDFLVPTLNAALPEIPDENWSWEIGSIYAERITGKGGLWEHNQISQVVDIDLLQKPLNHGLRRSEYTQEEIITAYTAKEGSVASGYIFNGSTLNSAFSGWARIRNAAEFNNNVLVHPKGSLQNWQNRTIQGTSYARRTGYLSWYAGWPVVQAGDKTKSVVTIPHCWTPFELWVPADVYNGVTGADPPYGVVASKPNEYEPYYVAAHEAEFYAKWLEHRYAFFKRAFLEQGIPVLILTGINSWFPDDTGCSDEDDFIRAHRLNYFEHNGDIVQAEMNSCQAFGYWTGWDLIKYMINTQLGHGFTMDKCVLFGQSARGDSCRTLTGLDDEFEVCVSTSSDLFDYHWWFQRTHPIDKNGMGEDQAWILEDWGKKKGDRSKAFFDFYNYGNVSAFYKRKGRKYFSLMQTAEGVTPITGPDLFSPFNGNSERTRPYWGTRQAITYGTEVEVENLLGAGETYDQVVAGVATSEFTFAGVFRQYPGMSGDHEEAAQIVGYIEDDSYNQYEFTTIATGGTALYGLLQVTVDSVEYTLGAYVYGSSLVLFDKTTFETLITSGLAFSKFYVQSYKSDDGHRPSDINLTYLADNVIADVLDGDERPEHAISDVSFAWDRPNSKLQITVTFSVETGATVDSVRAIALTDDPEDFSGAILFTDYDNYHEEVVNSPTSPQVIEMTYTELGITNPDTDTEKLAILVELVDTAPTATERHETSRAYILNMNDLTEYKNAYYLSPEYTQYGEYVILYSYQDDELNELTARSDSEHYKIGKFKGNGRTFRWGVRADGADKPVEIFGEPLITYVRPQYHSGGTTR